MKKRIITICLVAALLLLAAGGTLAYFTAEDEATNTFTVGNVGIELTEPNWDATEAKDVYPGEALAKDPTVKNVGKNPCFVKISVEGLDCLLPEGMITYRTANVEDSLGESWVKNGDYFYYTEVLQSGETTTALFDQIVIPTGVTNGDGVEKSVDVKAFAVQAQGAEPSFAEVQSMTVEEIAAWFTTCGL